MTWVVFALLAAIFTAVSAIVEKKTLFNQHAMKFSATLAVFNFFVSLIMLPRADFNIPLNVFYYIIPASILGATAFLLFAKALRHSEISESSSLMSFKPAMVFFLAFIFLKEKLTFYQIGGIFLLIIGAYILEIGNENKGILRPFKVMAESKYAHYIFLSIILYGVSSIFDKIILNYISPETYIITVHFFIALIFLAYITLFYNGILDVVDGIKTSWKWIGIVAILTTTYRVLQAQAVSMANVSLVSPIKQMSVLFTVAIGGRIFHEQNLKQKLFAALVMVIGATLLVI